MAAKERIKGLVEVELASNLAEEEHVAKRCLECNVSECK